MDLHAWALNPDALELAIKLRYEDCRTWSEVVDELNANFTGGFTYNAVVSKLRKHFGKKRKNKPASSKRKEIMLLPDVHMPFAHPLMRETIEQHARKDMTLIIPGDFFDMYSCSVFSKNEHIPLQTEMIAGHKILMWLSALFEEIIIIPGNHEERLNRLIENKIDPSISFLFNSSILLYYVRGFEIPGSEDTPAQYYCPIPNLKVHDNWFVDYGDAIIAHPKNYSKVPGKIALDAATYFKNWGHNFRAVFVAHTHQYARIVTNGMLAMEIGCNCDEHGYALSGKLGFRPQVNAITIVAQYDGQTEFNETRSIIYG